MHFPWTCSLYIFTHFVCLHIMIKQHIRHTQKTIAISFQFEESQLIFNAAKVIDSFELDVWMDVYRNGQYGSNNHYSNCGFGISV